jgi:hypothetical protein
MYVRHEISDYATWRKSYDAFNAERTKMSVTGAAVYRAVDNPNDVTVTHDFKSADKAKEFASSAPFEGSHGEGWRQGRSTNLVHHSCREITFGLEPGGKRLGAMHPGPVGPTIGAISFPEGGNGTAVVAKWVPAYLDGAARRLLVCYREGSVGSHRLIGRLE